MYIDSPVFVRRKVLINAADHAQGQQYKFGSQRQKIAQHVRQQINEHGNDALILQKFRREAEQLKRQKFQSKKKQNIPAEIYQQPQVYNEEPKSRSRHHQDFEQNPQIAPTFSRVIDEPRSSVIHLKQVQHHHELPQISHQIEDRIMHHYEVLLKGKDKQLRRKQKKLDKSRLVIEKMNGKIKQMRHQKRLSEEEQELEKIKINALVEEMHYRIAENKAAFREELAKLKQNMSESKVYNPPQLVGRNTQRNFSVAELPRKEKLLPKHHDSERMLQAPSIYYELPAKSAILPEPKLQSFEDSLSTLKSNSFSIQSQLQKYKQLF